MFGPIQMNERENSILFRKTEKWMCHSFAVFDLNVSWRCKCIFRKIWCVCKLEVLLLFTCTKRNAFRYFLHLYLFPFLSKYHSIHISILLHQNHYVSSIQTTIQIFQVIQCGCICFSCVSLSSSRIPSLLV